MAPEAWYVSREAGPVRGNRSPARFSVPADSLFFPGHFPGRPVVPGMALLAMADDAVRSADMLPGAQTRWFRRVRFRSLVEGAADFDVLLSPAGGEAQGIDFEVLHRGEPAADGLVEAGTPSAGSPVPAVDAGPEAGAPAAWDPPPAADAGWPAPPALPAADPGLDVEALIPHRDPMRLLGEVLSAEPGRCLARSVVGPAWPLATPDGVPPLVLPELLAQTASALVGWERRDQEAVGGKGYLVGVRLARWTIPRLPAGTELLTEVTKIRQRDNYAVFLGHAYSGSRPIARVELQAFRP